MNQGEKDRCLYKNIPDALSVRSLSHCPVCLPHQHLQQQCPNLYSIINITARLVGKGITSTTSFPVFFSLFKTSALALPNSSTTCCKLRKGRTMKKKKEWRLINVAVITWWYSNKDVKKHLHNSWNFWKKISMRRVRPCRKNWE